MLSSTSNLPARLSSRFLPVLSRYYSSNASSSTTKSSPTKFQPAEPNEPQKTSSTARSTLESRIPTNDPNPKPVVAPGSGSNDAHPHADLIPSTSGGVQDAPLREVVDPETARVIQAPNRATVWSRSQQPRERAMTGPRFEQTMMEHQPRPQAAISLIHKQPVRWTDEKFVSCDGGGGPLGHPRIFINVDKPQVNMCTYCGLPFVSGPHQVQDPHLRPRNM